MAGYLVLAGLAQGQTIILKDGSKLGPEQFRIEGGKVVKLVKIGEQTSKAALPLNSVAKLEWPVSEELVTGSKLMAEGKTAEAMAMLKKGMEMFEPLKDVEGNWFADLSFAYVEALVQAGEVTDVVKTLPSLKSLKLSDAQKLKLKIIQLNMDRQTGANADAVVGQAQNILGETDDSSVGASLWTIIGDVYFKQKQWEKALLAYLRVPVFYGTQVQKVPEAEFLSAQCLAKMKRFEDAQSYYKRLIETYPGSTVAEKAAKESAAINGLKNEDETTAGKPAAPKTDDKKDGTTAAAAAEPAPATPEAKPEAAAK
ncbi:MAG: hypothetical protein JWO08_430 [Verrucomicrobiaceae bacterium]|nr:hypothetical protein [Verrucomicrobiaceae bacterium]